MRVEIALRSVSRILQVSGNAVAIGVSAAGVGADVHQEPQPESDPVKSDDPAREYEDIHERRSGQEDESQDRPDEIRERELPANGIDEPPDQDSGSWS